MVHALSNPFENAHRLTQSILQIIDMLDIYRAELARTLHIHCDEVGFLAEGKRNLVPDTDAWHQAVLFVRLYEALFAYCKGDGVAMCHWLRAENKDLKGVPMLLIVDDDKLSKVLGFLESSLDIRHSGNSGGAVDRLVKWTKSKLTKKR